MAENVTLEQFLGVAATLFREYEEKQRWGQLDLSVEFKNGDAKRLRVTPTCELLGRDVEDFVTSET